MGELGRTRWRDHIRTSEEAPTAEKALKDQASGGLEVRLRSPTVKIGTRKVSATTHRYYW